MNKILNYTVLVVALIALVVGLVGVGGNNQSQIGNLGASGSRFPNGISADSTSPSVGQVRGTTLKTTGSAVVGEFTQGGGVLASSTTATAGTLTEAELLAYNYIAFTANTGNTTLTLPATSTMTTLLASAGDMRTWIIENATTTAATTLTVAAGTGIDLRGVSNAVDVLDGTEFAGLTCIRRTNTDVMCIITENEVAD